MITTSFVLWLILPDGRQQLLGKHDNIYACAGHAARERHAQVQVQQKTQDDLGYRFICKPERPHE